MSNESTYVSLTQGGRSASEIAEEIYTGLAFKLDNPEWRFAARGLAFADPDKEIGERTAVYRDAERGALEVSVELGGPGLNARVRVADPRHVAPVHKAMVGAGYLSRLSDVLLGSPSNLNETRPPKEHEQFERGYEGVY